MATRTKPQQTRTLPPLENGDQLDQQTFHARYAAMPEDCRAELIEGIVYMASPQKFPHSKTHQLVSHWLGEYVNATSGTEAVLNNTQILGPDSEPQPDACLFIAPEYGGQVYVDEDEYLNGSPELIVEVSASTESIDLHRKKNDYQKAGVREYVVLALRMQQVFWFVRQRGKYKEVPFPADGIFRSREFPGLWLDAEAMLSNHRQRSAGDSRARPGDSRTRGFCRQAGEASVQEMTANMPTMSAQGLLLSDDLLFTSRVTGTAKALGLTVQQARSASALVELARRSPPRGVLIDLHNPALDLPALLRRPGRCLSDHAAGDRLWLARRGGDTACGARGGVRSRPAAQSVRGGIAGVAGAVAERVIVSEMVFSRFCLPGMPHPDMLTPN